MPDQVIAPTPQQVSQPQNPEANPPAPADDRVQKLESIILDLQKQVVGLSAAQRAAKRDREREEQAPTQEQNVTLKSLKSELEARDARTRDRAINVEMDAFFKESGIPPAQAKILKAYIRAEYAAKKTEDGSTTYGLTTDENDQVVFIDELNNKKSFADIGKTVLTGLGAQAFMPPVQTPGQVGSRSPFGGNSGPQVPAFGNMSVEQMIANPAMADAAMQAAAAQLMQGNTIRT